MRRIAILGANSQIASDLIRAWSSSRPDMALHLYSRKPGSLGYDRFGLAPEPYDAVLNFVGVGDPARAAKMGSSILGVTREYDDMALRYLERFPACRYIFLSSGAVYGSGFSTPAERGTRSSIDINDLPLQQFYAVAKLHAEACHRALSDKAIVDIRVFNIFSRTQSIEARFFITDIVRAIRDGSLLETSADPMVRDFLHPSDFQRVVDAVLSAPATNAPVDCYSKSPIEKFALLEAMGAEFGLRWKVKDDVSTVNATGAKPMYFSVNRRAAEFGYSPQLTSLDGLRLEVAAMLAAAPDHIE